MKSLVLFILIASYTPWTGINAHGIIRKLICDSDYSGEFQTALNDFTTKFTKQVAIHSLNHFVVSPLTIWQSISAIAEGAHGSAQRDLFNVLNLPNEKCIRQQYYQIARSLQNPNYDVFMYVDRALVIDDSLLIQRVWDTFQQSEGLLNITRMPIQGNPQLISNYLRKTIVTPIDLIPTGYSILTNTFIYEALWTTAFSGIVRGPFYNDDQQQVGTVNYMTATMQVKMARLPTLNAKVLELPVGHDRRYSMLIATGSEHTSITNLMAQIRSTTITEIIDALIMSYVPINIAIPQFEMTSEFDARFISEKLGIFDLWTDSFASRQVSIPAAVPVGLLHHASVKLDEPGVYPSPQLNVEPSAPAGVTAADFVANKPFMYVLIDAKFKTALLYGSYSIPTPTTEVKWII